jgi:hypothetical protein
LEDWPHEKWEEFMRSLAEKNESWSGKSIYDFEIGYHKFTNYTPIVRNSHNSWENTNIDQAEEVCR